MTATDTALTSTDAAPEFGRISLRQLVKQFDSREGATLAVDHIDLDTEAGEFVTLLGPSGCGKPQRCGWSPASKPRRPVRSPSTAPT